MPQDVKDYFQAVLDGKTVNQLEQQLTHGEANESVKYKHIIPFSKFIR